MDLINLLQGIAGNNSPTNVSELDVLSPSGRTPPFVPVQKREPIANPPEGYRGVPILMDSPAPKRRSTLRNILGTLGDAFLIRDGLDPIYRPTVEREKLAEAMSGLGNDPMGVINRVASLPVPGAAKLAQDLYSDYQTSELRRQQQESLELNRQSLIEDRELRREDTKLYRREEQLRRLTPLLGALVNDPSIRTKDEYTRAYNKAITAARRIDPEITSADLGFWEPEEWEPGRGTTAGMTQGQNVRNQTTQRGQDITARGQDLTNARGIRGQDISSADRRRGQDMTNERAERTNRAGGSILPPGLRPGGSSTPSTTPQTQKFTHTATGPNGQKKGWNGKQWVDIK